MANIFDHLKSITDPKAQFLGDDGWTNWMINRYISMHQGYVEVVNEVQKNTWQMEPRFLFAVYKDLLPQRSHWFKYIKGAKKDVNWEYVNILREYFEISKNEAIEYLEDMSEDELLKIFNDIGYVPKTEKVKDKIKKK